MQLLIQYIRSYPPYLETFFTCNLRMCHAVVPKFNLGFGNPELAHVNVVHLFSGSAAFQNKNSTVFGVIV
jgi:hypothetical protein